VCNSILAGVKGAAKVVLGPGGSPVGKVSHCIGMDARHCIDIVAVRRESPASHLAGNRVGHYRGSAADFCGAISVGMAPLRSA